MTGIVIGLDYGSAYSKLMVRDLSTDSAFQVPAPRGEHIQEPGDPFGKPLALGLDASPSRITLLNDRLYFGWDGLKKAQASGAVAIPSLKRSFGIGWPSPKPYPGKGTPEADALRGRFRTQDLVYLEGLYQAQRGARFLAGRGLGPVGEAPRWALTLPPGAEPTAAPLQRAIARTLRGAPIDMESGLSLGEAEALVAEGARLGPDSLGASLIRVAESDGALAFFERADRLQDGLYCAISIGAGFASAMFFSRGGGGAPGRCQRLSLAHLNHGVDDLTAPLGMATGAVDFTALRGNEGPIFVGERGSCGVERDLFLHRLKGVYLDAFRQALSHEAHGHALWEGDYGLILSGGGSWLRPFREPMLTRAHPDVRRDPSLVEPGKPYDLKGEDGEAHTGEAYFSQVAYGAATCAAVSLEAAALRSPDGLNRP